MFMKAETTVDLEKEIMNLWTTCSFLDDRNMVALWESNDIFGGPILS